jgi:hypothetical protein
VSSSQLSVSDNTASLALAHACIYARALTNVIRLCSHYAVLGVQPNATLDDIRQGELLALVTRAHTSMTSSAAMRSGSQAHECLSLSLSF